MFLFTVVNPHPFPPWLLSLSLFAFFFQEKPNNFLIQQRPAFTFDYNGRQSTLFRPITPCVCFMQNRKNNMTIDTTFGLPLDQTSYMSIADGYHGDDDADGSDVAGQSIPKLKNALSNTRSV